MVYFCNLYGFIKGDLYMVKKECIRQNNTEYKFSIKLYFSSIEQDKSKATETNKYVTDLN